MWIALLLLISSAQASESWYSYWSFGFGTANYSSELTQLLESSQSSETDRMIFNFDLYGFYWPMQDSPTLFGGVIGLTGDFVYQDFSVKNGAISQLLVGPSMMRFFSGEIGRGIFGRADIGISKYAIDIKAGGRNSARILDSSSIGYGIGLGTGYALPVSDETRLLFNLGWKYNRAGGQPFQLLTASVGVLL